jgi:fatty-acyl-CoA synthase
MTMLPDITARRAALSPDAIAFHVVTSGEKISYRQLDRRASQAAAVLQDHGICQGQRVAILCRNRVEFFEALFACAKLGAILVPLNWRMPASELAGLVADCQPSLLLAGSEDGGVAAAITDGTKIQLLDLETDYKSQRDVASPHAGRSEWPANETWYLIYTSGTTGQPKGVIQTYQMALINYVNISQAIGLRGTDATLNFLPLFHTAGINLHTLPVLIAGGLNHIMPGFDAGQMLALIGDGGIDVFIGVPAIYQELTLHQEFESTDLSQIRHWACGGAPLPDPLVRTFARKGAIVCNGFGMSETGPTAFLVDPGNALTKIGSVGKSQIMVEARIASPDNAPLGIDQTGEIQFRGPGLTPGYWQREPESAALFTEDGWLKSGDIGRFDADGYCFVVGRIKEMYISGGENVYPAEIENVLAQHPAVLEAAIIGVEDSKWGEVGCAYVLLREGQAGDTTHLTQWCRKHLAAFKVPKHFVFADTFPRTAAGKVQKHLLPYQEAAS